MLNFASKMSFNSLFGAAKPTAQCISEEEAAAEFQKILESNNGQMPSDPEEMQALLAAHRPTKKRNPMPFERLIGGTRLAVKSHRPNDGIIFEVPLPLSQRLMTNLTWQFSNSKASKFSTTVQMVGGNANNPMADQD